MESWGNLINSLDADEVDDIFWALCGRLEQNNITQNTSVSPANLPSNPDDGKENDEGIAVLSSTRTHLLCADRPPGDNFSKLFSTDANPDEVVQLSAPRYTMVPQGDVAEVTASQSPAQECSAVDLCAGTSHFAFSHAAAGVNKIFCWDLNTRNIEGLRRDALAKGWGVQTFYGDELPPEDESVQISSETRVFVFVETNGKALPRVEKMRISIPPIRHVNCGSLPRSKRIYEIATAIVDPDLGGWIHVHANFSLDKIDTKVEEVRLSFQKLIGRLDRKRKLAGGKKAASREVTVDRVQRMVPYAPGVFHCIVDICIPQMPV